MRLYAGMHLVENHMMVIPDEIRKGVTVLEWILGWVPGQCEGRRPWEWTGMYPSERPNPRVAILGKYVYGHPATLQQIRKAISNYEVGG